MKTRRDTEIHIRLSEEERDYLDHKASEKRLSTSAWCRMVLLSGLTVQKLRFPGEAEQEG